LRHYCGTGVVSGPSLLLISIEAVEHLTEIPRAAVDVLVKVVRVDA
jgi:hypothetical protein